MLAIRESSMPLPLFQRPKGPSKLPSKLKGLALVAFLAAPLSSYACDETPRGEQGIDFTDDAGNYSVPPSPEAGPDAHGPCADETDTTGICTQASEQGVPYPNLVECTGSAPPVEIECVPGGTPQDGGLIAYCCEPGII
jgi:hypothetical protein